MSDPRFDALFSWTSVMSLVFQISATALIAVLSFVVSRAVRRRQMLFWAAGWTAYAIALLNVFEASRTDAVGRLSLFSYFLFEYVAVILICAGCSVTAGGAPLSRRWFWWLVPAVAAAAVLTAWPATFFWKFATHATIVALGWLACLAVLWPAIRRRDAGPGVRIVGVGLVLLAVDYMHHLPTGLYLAAHHLTQSPYYYTVISLVDGMLEFVLGFGTVVVIVDKVRADLEAANVQLQAAHDRAALALHTDPLTEVLSRYSFTAAFEGAAERRSRRGSLIVVDLDGLKQINDSFGHAIGDAAIRAVAGGIRSLIRHEDRVYRWGGDEFVVVMYDMPLDSASKRMGGLDEAINRALRTGAAPDVRLTVSWGAAAFEADTPVKDALTRADAAMYEHKSRRKTGTGGVRRA